MTKHFDKELETLNHYLIKMADLVISNINKAIDAYLKNKKPSEVYVNDDLVDQYERLVEEYCLDIILKEHPVAKDLRLVSGILKLITDLERIGDHAEDILEFYSKVSNYNENYKISNINSMATTASKMILDSVDAFVKGDVALAESVIKEDDVVDALYDNIIKELIIKDKNNELSSDFAIYTTLIVKYIERIADHAVNIAEWVIFIINGYHKDTKVH